MSTKSTKLGELADDYVRGLREGRHQGIRAVIAALQRHRSNHAYEAARWLESRDGEVAIELEIDREDERRGRLS